MFKKLDKRGFTLAELLIVVAIIGVLVAISIPIFTAQLRKARLATNQANARAAYAAVVADQLQKGITAVEGTYDVTTAKASTKDIGSDTVVAMSPFIDGWKVSTSVGQGTLGDVQVTKWKVSIGANGNVNIVATDKKKSS